MEAFISLLMSTLRVSTPLVFTGMGGLMSERSGVINIALEGLMLVGAFAGAAAASYFHSPWIGALFGILAGVVLALIYGFFVILMKSDQIVAGTAINLLAFGAVPLLSKGLFDSTGSTPSLEMAERFGTEPLWIALICVTVIHFWFKYSRLGLWIRFAGEHPEALSTAGISVRPIRWSGVTLSGALAGMGGVTLSIFLSSSYSRGMTAGRGFMALAALIFGKWKPIPTAIACVFFGFADAMQIRLQGVAVFGDQPIPVQFIQILPYVVTVLVLAGFVGKSRAPSSLGQPWVVVAVLLFGGAGLSGCSKIDELAVKWGLKKPSLITSMPGSSAEVFQEMVRVVFESELRDQSVISGYAGALDQGASLEGIYNGLVHSSMYRAAEEKSARGTPEALQYFLKEFSKIQAGLQEPIEVDEKSAGVLAEPEYPTGEPVSSSNESSTVASLEKDSSKLSARYEKIFSQAKIYTLKRVLGDALVRANSKEDRVLWIQLRSMHLKMNELQKMKAGAQS